MVLGELMPKTLAIQYADKMTLLLAPSLYWFGQVSKSFIALLNGSAQLLLKVFGVKPSKHNDVYSEVGEIVKKCTMCQFSTTKIKFKIYNVYYCYL